MVLYKKLTGRSLTLVKAGRQKAAPGQLGLFDANQHPRDGHGKFKAKYSGDDGLDEHGSEQFDRIEASAIAKFRQMIKTRLPANEVSFTDDGELSAHVMSTLDKVEEAAKQSVVGELDEVGIDLEESRDWLDWEALASAVEDYAEKLYEQREPEQPKSVHEMTLGEIQAELKVAREMGGYKKVPHERFLALLDGERESRG